MNMCVAHLIVAASSRLEAESELCVPFMLRIGVCIQVYRALWRFFVYSLYSLPAGIFLLLCYLLASTVFSDGGCISAFQNLTISHIAADSMFQWLFVCGIAIFLGCRIVYLLREKEFEQFYTTERSIISFLECMLDLFDVPTPLHAINHWQNNMMSAKRRSTHWLRFIAATLLGLLVLCLVSIPSIGYVISLNIPTGR